MNNWTISQSRETYNLPHWGDDYVDINQRGHLVIKPGHQNGPEIDLHELAFRIRDEQELAWPVLVRFTHILHDRVYKIKSAFATAIQETGFKADYTPVYPIKVNQQRTVVENLLGDSGADVGLEAGSKPELMAVLALSPDSNATIICNGYKDREYVRLALIGQQLGYKIFIVIEKPNELELILQEAAQMGLEPTLGVRVRLASMGKGKWQNTGGEKSKFGLSSSQVLSLVQQLRRHGKSHCLRLLHAHLGSQIANIRDIQTGMREVARYFAELHQLGHNIDHVDVGGGLGVDYEGTRSRSVCSMNYSVQEYANDVIHALWEICNELDLPHPHVITESGRAMTAHHAVLISNVTDVEQAPVVSEFPEALANDDSQIVQNLYETYQDLSKRSIIESYHDAVHWMSEAQTQYLHGMMNLQQRAAVEQLYYSICDKIKPLLNSNSRAHREVMDELTEKLSDKFFCNLSVFQSLPDVWGIDQIFPIIPLHRLDEQPLRRATIQDLTCDSDGTVEHYINQDSINTSLPLHLPQENEPYLLGIFMVGAYQEILGDLHNLFGDTHSINVDFVSDSQYALNDPELGDNVDDVLSYVHFDPQDLLARFQRKISNTSLDADTQAHYLEELAAGLTGYTYLED